MTSSKKTLTAAIHFIIGTSGIVSTASAVTFTFQNNATATNPANTLLGFPAGSEFHVVNEYGTDVVYGNHDVIFGGEQWVFDGDSTGSLMSAVTNTSTNSGGGNDIASLTTGVPGFPVATTPGTVATIQQATSFYLADRPITMAAPLTGNIIGQTFGAGFIDSGTTADFTQVGTFAITMPVIHTQWDTSSIIVGGDPNIGSSGDKCNANGPCNGPGVVFEGTTDGAGYFTLSASRIVTLDETSNPGFGLLTFQWSLGGTYSISAIPLPPAAWLFGSSLAGLVGVARRRRRCREA